MTSTVTIIGYVLVAYIIVELIWRALDKHYLAGTEISYKHYLPDTEISYKHYLAGTEISLDSAPTPDLALQYDSAATPPDSAPTQVVPVCTNVDMLTGADMDYSLQILEESICHRPAEWHGIAGGIQHKSGAQIMFRNGIFLSHVGFNTTYTDPLRKALTPKQRAVCFGV